MKKKSKFGFTLTGEKMTKKELRARIRHIETWLEQGKYKAKTKADTAALIFDAQKQAAAYRYQLTHFTRNRAKKKKTASATVSARAA